MPIDYTQAGGSQYRAPANRWDSFTTDQQWKDWIKGANQDGETTASATGKYNAWKQQQNNMGMSSGSGGGGGGPVESTNPYGGGVSPLRVMPDAQQSPSPSTGVQTTDSVLYENNRRPVQDLTMPDTASGLPMGPSAPQMWDPGAGVSPARDVLSAQQQPTGWNDNGTPAPGSPYGQQAAPSAAFVAPVLKNYYADLVNPYTSEYAAQAGGMAASNVNEQGANVERQLRDQAAARGLSQAGYSGIEAQGQRQNAQDTAIARAKAYNEAMMQTKQLGAAFDFTKAGGQMQYNGQAQDAAVTNALMSGRITAQDLANLAAQRGITRSDSLLPGEVRALDLANTGASIRNTGGVLANTQAVGMMPYQEEAARLANVERMGTIDRNSIEGQKAQLDLDAIRENAGRIQRKIAQGLDLDVQDQQYRSTLLKWAAEHPDAAQQSGIWAFLGQLGGVLAANAGNISTALRGGQ